MVVVVETNPVTYFGYFSHEPFPLACCCCCCCCCCYGWCVVDVVVIIIALVVFDGIEPSLLPSSLPDIVVEVSVTKQQRHNNWFYKLIVT